MQDELTKRDSSGGGPTLLDWVLRRFPNTPKTRAKQWIQSGRVTVGGQVIRKPHHALADPGEALELLGRTATTLDCGQGWQIHPRVGILYLDPSFAVLNKGAGLVSVPAPNCELSALSILADYLAGRLRARDRAVACKSLPAVYRRLDPLPVHRLDQYTTGVFCAALTPAARAHLIDQLKAHTLRREYVAFVEGRPSSPKGVWRQWIEPCEDGIRQRIVPAPSASAGETEAKEAITHYEVLAEYPFAAGGCFVSKLRLRLETGRKHQIRVQAAHAGLPLIGDRSYHPMYRLGKQASCPIPFARQALHAEMLSLEHPDRPGTRLSWTAQWPKDLRQLENDLRAGRF